jgi:hypothetical protein
VPLIYVAGTLIVDGDAAATARKVLASGAWFHACLLSELPGALLLLFMARALDRLLGWADKGQASLMVSLVLASPCPSFSSMC